MNDTLSMKSWEILSLMMISKTIDELQIDDFHDNTDTGLVKRLVKSYLPAIPDETKISALPTVLDVSWFGRPKPGETCEIELPPGFQGRAGEKHWLLFDCEDPDASPEFQTRFHNATTNDQIDLSTYGLVQCTLGHDALESTILRRRTSVSIIQFLSFQDFPKYFQCQGDWKAVALENGVAIPSSPELDYHRSTTNFHYIGWDYDASTFDHNGAFLVRIDNQWYSTLWMPKVASKSPSLAFLAVVPSEEAAAMGLETEDND